MSLICFLGFKHKKQRSFSLFLVRLALETGFAPEEKILDIAIRLEISIAECRDFRNPSKYPSTLLT
jgi:hypothetical protein